MIFLLLWGKETRIKDVVEEEKKKQFTLRGMNFIGIQLYIVLLFVVVIIR